MTFCSELGSEVGLGCVAEKDSTGHAGARPTHACVLLPAHQGLLGVLGVGGLLVTGLW